MSVSRRLRFSVVFVCLLALSGVAVSAGSPASAAKPKTANGAKPVKKSKVKPVAKPSRPSGPGQAAEAIDAYFGGKRIDSVVEHRNRAGATVYAVGASHFDISPALRELAATTPGLPIPDGDEDEEENENEQLPAFRQIRSNVPDPVVQVAPRAGDRSFAPTAQVVSGFNFLGIGITGGSPSDSNGSVGNDQFVETVNSRYQVWSLNRVTSVATSILGPASINTLWSGFGGACQTQNSGDPIVLYDKVANRWLISQFTSTASSGVYYQCVAISTTPNAIGSYFRYAFAVPSGAFGDYPHFGVWRDAYYMMGHAFASSAGGYIAAMFAALDRGKMLQGDPGATWQVILDPSEGGHMPADHDGFAPPPAGAPGVFLSIHGASMWFYRMSVDFAVPANTVNTLDAMVPIAPATAACGGGTCIPQPGTSTTLGSLADRLMFRAAYRNFIDHESLVVSHSVDPSVQGLVSGVRWYDFRLSGTPDAVCPTYPCLYQQGTIADAPGGRSRWMSSIAMDSVENMLVGYSTTGTSNGSDNHSLRYTGRGRTDPPGTVSVLEATIFTGTANNTGSRWGDYSSMSVDPFDDCTFWYVGQYYASSGLWSTRVASAKFRPGNFPGQCAATSCTSRPTSTPDLDSVTATGDNQITVSWGAVFPAAGSYAIERAEGECGSEGPYRPVGAVSGATSFIDTTVQGGLTYSYRVIAASDTVGRCQALTASSCGSADATGTCSLVPDFAGATSASSANQESCGVVVSWDPATSRCPLTPNMRYNVYRGTSASFVPSAATRVASCIAGPTSYVDSDALTSGATYYYVVRAEDDSTGNGGACGGNEDPNHAIATGTPYGPGNQPTPGTWSDGGGDATAFLQLNAPGGGNTTDQPWRIVSTADDPGVNHTPGGGFGYRNSGPGPAASYSPNVCAEMRSPLLTAGGSGVNLKYWERHQIEYRWDGVAVEYAINGGAWTDIPAPSNAAGTAAPPVTPSPAGRL